MMKFVIKSHRSHFKEEVKNVILNRVLHLMGSDLLQEELREEVEETLKELEEKTRRQKDKVNLCIAIADKTPLHH